jgi:hypothetical protein
MNDAITSAPRPRGVSMTTLVLGIALAAAATAAVVLAVLHFTGGGPAGPGGQTFVQKDTVKPQGHASGEVVYPLPFAAPPHVKLTAPHRPYTITKQSETGFSWAADEIEDDFSGDQNAIKTALRDHNVQFALFNNQFTRKPEIVYEDFTWEATGVPVGAAGDLGLPFEQTGTFQSVLGKDGQEYFAIPYASPPQVTLSGHNGTTIVVEATTGGFKWKNEGTDNPFPGNNAGQVSWTAKGLRAAKPSK